MKSQSQSKSGAQSGSEARSAVVVTQVPRWVKDVAVVRSGRDCLVMITRDLEMPGETGGQFVADVPAGRYLVETLDIDGASWVSRESAAGNPLVAGLVCPGSAVLLRIRPVD